MVIERASTQGRIWNAVTVPLRSIHGLHLSPHWTYSSGNCRIFQISRAMKAEASLLEKRGFVVLLKQLLASCWQARGRGCSQCGTRDRTCPPAPRYTDLVILFRSMFFFFSLKTKKELKNLLEPTQRPVAKDSFFSLRLFSSEVKISGIFCLQGKMPWFY